MMSLTLLKSPTRCIIAVWHTCLLSSRKSPASPLLISKNSRIKGAPCWKTCELCNSFLNLYNDDGYKNAHLYEVKNKIMEDRIQFLSFFWIAAFFLALSFQFAAVYFTKILITKYNHRFSKNLIGSINMNELMFAYRSMEPQKLRRTIAKLVASKILIYVCVLLAVSIYAVSYFIKKGIF